MTDFDVERWVPYARSVLHNRYPAWRFDDEAEADLRLVIWQAHRSHNPERAAWESYLARMICWRCVDELRHRTGRTHLSTGRNTCGSENLEHTTLDPRDMVDEVETLVDLTRAMDRLDPRSRSIVVDTYVNGRTLDELGERYGVTASMACRLRGVAIQRLRLEMGVAA